MLKDSFNRIHDYLRISLTDRCNLRCSYCMPPEGIKKISHSDVMRIEEIIHTIKIFSKLGVKKVRFTGGEPLLRKGLDHLLTEVTNQFPELEFCITTNGILLNRYHELFHELGIRKLNISLDTLCGKNFKRICSHDYLKTVIENIDKALSYKSFEIKLNAVLLESTLNELSLFFDKYADTDITMRFIEKMNLSDKNDNLPKVISGDLIRHLKKNGDLRATGFGIDGVSKCYDYFSGGRKLKIGIISPVTCNFCPDCSRLRITASGEMHNCLYDDSGLNLRDCLRSGMTEAAIIKKIQNALLEKKEIGIGVLRGSVPMSSLGG